MSQVACDLEITITQPWDYRLGYLFLLKIRFQLLLVFWLRKG